MYNFILLAILRNLRAIRHNQLDKRTFLKGIKQLKEAEMATKQEVLDAIAEEKAQVIQKINDLNTLIDELKAQIAAGTAATPADLDEIKSSINDIFIPSA